MQHIITSSFLTSSHRTMNTQTNTDDALCYLMMVVGDAAASVVAALWKEQHDAARRISHIKQRVAEGREEQHEPALKHSTPNQPASEYRVHAK